MNAALVGVELYPLQPQMCFNVTHGHSRNTIGMPTCYRPIIDVTYYRDGSST